MKKTVLAVSVFSLILTSCGGEMTWEEYKESCVAVTKMLSSEEEANVSCDCEIEKYKAANLKPAEVLSEKSSDVDISDCKI